MEQKTVSPPQQRSAGLPVASWLTSDTPVYDALERQWLADGRDVPRPSGLPFGGRPMDADDLFSRA
ncbi:hypothetical protein [Streptomyces sp. NPDC058613]|uniref:hypothetical protein n=1 Tax=Streptomyces sp. NPDC058613 TaxID=3346556 RepID=UPI00366256D7